MQRYKRNANGIKQSKRDAKREEQNCIAVAKKN
jgi:hypothetical protein